ncbi:MAG: hypothetical protein QOK03_1152 [Candidatus Binataceae bacterium]|nr:hypothetical protein [Candidatus Binataceae bacterium]
MILASYRRELQKFSGGENEMPDESEILLQEIAILRQEIADVRGALDNLDQLVRALNVPLLQCVDQLTALTQKMLLPVN